MELPVDLVEALEEELQHVPAKVLARACDQLSRRYRAGRTAGAYLKSENDIAAYAAFRVPATFAATYAAAAQVRERLPESQLRAVLDVGAGLGTAAWAASGVWPGLEGATLVEKDARMIAYGKRLAGHADSPALQGALWQRQDCTDGCEGGPFDLVMMAYALGEVPAARRHTLIRQLLSSTGGVLLIVEPGTSAGFALIRDARQVLIREGVSVVAPCPHSGECPMPRDNWCHFSQRVARTRLHRSAKQASLGYEDEKFAYVAVSREAGRPVAARVIRHPQIRSGHIRLELCTETGLQQQVVSRRNRQAFRLARRLRWGSALDAPIGEDSGEGA